MDLNLGGKRAIVTGASRGIGRAVARCLAEEGADLAICARGEETLREAAGEFSALGVKVFHRAVDISDAPALDKFIADSGAELGGIDILVHNPSAMSGTGDDHWRKSLEIDLLGADHSVNAALPFLERSGAASVVFIGTIAAVETFSGIGPYGPIKAALLAHSSNLSQALAEKGIRVNTVSPGAIYFEGGTWDKRKQSDPELFESVRARTAMGRMGTPEEIARAVAFLASPAASYCTGANLIADGGLTKRVHF